MLFLTILGFGCSAIDIGLLGYAWDDFGPVNGVFLLATLLPSISVGTRRLHDIGMSGWWQLIIFVPFIGIVLLIFWWCKQSQQPA